MSLAEVRLLGPSPALVPLDVTFGYEVVANRPEMVYPRKRTVQP